MNSTAGRPLEQPLPVETAQRANASGGGAAAGGMNLHARVAAVAAVHLLGRQSLRWLKELEVDTPVEIWCETNGPGDDLRLVLANGQVVEAQAKKGLTRGEDLWTALGPLAQGIYQESISYGVLVVDIDASATIRRGLARGIVRLGEGRDDSLDYITTEFKHRLESTGLPVQTVCGRLRIVVVHCADHDDASEQAARAELRRLCVTERDADNALAAIQLSAHGLIERRGRWTAATLSGVLRTALVELRSTPDQTPLTAISGWAWEHLDELSDHRGYVQSFRQHYLVSDQMAAQPFGGRDAEFDGLDSWLFDTAAPSRKLICAPTARGKSALLVQWTERLVSDATWAVVFVPISLRFNTDRPAVFYALLATQLARLRQAKLAPPSTDLDAYYQGVSAALLIQAAKECRHVLVVVDGLDEAQGVGFNPTVFPPSLPANIKVLVSAREQAGDQGPEGWLKRLGWQGSVRATSDTLKILDRPAVAPILESTGIAKPAISDALIDRLMELSTGEPLLLSLYAQDLSAIARGGGHFSVKSLEGLSPGLSAYFSLAFDSSGFAGEHGGQEAVDTTLAVLAFALGPLEGPHLTDLVCRLCSLPRPVASDRFVRPLKRFIAGNGRADHGYVLNHPKLGEYLREERFGSPTRQLVEFAFVEWGRGVAAALSADPSALASTYVLRHHVEHLRRSGSSSLNDVELLLTDGWRQAWFRVDKDYVGYADSLLSASVAMQPCAAYGAEASRALHLRIKIGLLAGSVKSQGINVPSELLGIAIKEQLITLRQALNIAELQVPENRPSYLLALASSLSAAELEQLLSDVLQTANIENRMDQLARLAPHLRETRRGEVVDQVLSWLRTESAIRTRVGIVAVLVPACDESRIEAVLISALSERLAPQEAASAVISLAPVIGVLRGRDRLELVERLTRQCLRWIDIASDPLLAVEGLRMLAPQIGASRMAAQIDRLAMIVEALQARNAAQPPATWDFAAQFRRERLASASVTLAVLQIDGLPIDAYRTSLMIALAPQLSPSYWTVDSLVKVVPIVRSDVRQEIAGLVNQLASKLPTANNRTHALMKLADAALPPLRRLIAEQAWIDARRIEDEYSLGLTLVSLYSTLPAAEKERELISLMGDIQKVNYALHFGELLLQVSDQLPAAAGLAEPGVQAILKVQDIGNSVGAMLREMPRIPTDRRGAVFQQCWQRMLARSDELSGFQFGMAARYATDFWTVEELDVVRTRLPSLAPHVRAHVLVDLLPVAIRLGARDLADEAIEEIQAQKDPNGALSHMVRAHEFLLAADPRRDLLRHYWFLSLDSDKPRTSPLIDAFELLDPEDKAVAWPKLTAYARRASEAGLSLARLSMAAQDPAERTELQEAALAACAAEAADNRIPHAAHIAATCRSTEVSWRAFDLMTARPAVSRETVMSALRIAAPALAEAGTASLMLALVDDVRQSASWWP